MMAALLFAPSAVRRSKKRLADYEQKHGELAAHLATDDGKISAGMFALGCACLLAVRRDPEYRSARDG